MKLDLSEIRNVLAHVEALLAVHHGQQIPAAQIGAAVRASGRLAELQSDLAAAREFLRLADAQLGAVGLVAAGRQDPRLSPLRGWQQGAASRSGTNRRAGTAPAQHVNLTTSLTTDLTTRVPAQPVVRV